MHQREAFPILSLNAQKRTLQSLIWSHFGANLLHTTAHLGAGVMNLSLFETIYVIGVILLAPFVALFWLSRSIRMGAVILAGVLIASFVFGFLNHLILPGDDLVAQVTGIWAVPFQLSAYLVLLLELMGVGLCLWMLFITRPYQSRRSVFRSNHGEPSTLYKERERKP